MVEAGGVEPPSEKVRSEEPTCVARFCYFGQYFRAGKRGTVPSPIDLESRLRTEVCTLFRCMTLTDQPADWKAGATPA